ncbi:MAG: glycine zipper 2TM domain-containing protein [Alphaproteobacteria bacterium]|nr:glycine zipper 2TM domain-containing protein [Alphaproteobacteria bacterium]
MAATKLTWPRAMMVVLLAVTLGACQTTGGQKQTGGTLLGAGLGALAGSQFGSGRGQLAAVAIGALGGAFLGNSVGKSLDSADRLQAERAARAAQTAPIGQPIEWRNPDSGNYGSVTPVREGNDRATGAYCREYQKTVTVNGRSEEAYGTACRQPDGSWKIL